MIVYRSMKPEDIMAGLSLCRFAGWNQRSRDWELFLHLSPDGCRVGIDEEGNVVGTVTTVRYQDHFSWIGMVLVDPARQRQGIGMQLLRESLKILKDEETIKLDATPAGREVYLKLNFRDEYRLSRMHTKGVFADKLAASTARPIHQLDWSSLLALDRQVFGADRQSLLEWMWKGAPPYAFVIEEKNQLKGYCFGRSGHHFTQIGPVIAQDLDSAINLVSAALRNCAGVPVILDVLHDTPEWVSWLSSIGFTEQRALIRMVRGTNAFPGVPEKQFAILGPEFG